MSAKKRKRQERPDPPGRTAKLGGKVFDPDMLPDRRAVEVALWQQVREAEGGVPETPLDRAQQLAYQAFGEPDARSRVQLAGQALSVCPDCADACVILAEATRNVEEAMEWYRKGVEAGERAIGKEAFKELRGKFWLVIQTRPYMRARLGLAHCLWELGHREESLRHLQEMLDLNPKDNQGVRFLLAARLLQLERHEELRTLREQYRDESDPFWAYCEALLVFRAEGDTPDSRRLAKRALKLNKYASEYLLDRPLPDEKPRYSSRGSREEAIFIAAELLPAWRNTPGAVTWIRKLAPVPRQAKRGSFPTDLREAISRLPQYEDEAWHVDCVGLSAPVRVGEGVSRAWVSLVVDVTNSQVLRVSLGDRRVPDAEMWRLLLEAFEKPKSGPPRRPGKICVRRTDRCQSWRRKLAAVDVRCEVAREMELVDELCERAVQMLPNQAPPPFDLLTPEDAERLRELPQQELEQWQLDVRLMPTWVRRDDGGLSRPWVLLITDSTNDWIMCAEVSEDVPDMDEIWFHLARAMACPAAGQARRPGVVEVRSEDHRNGLQQYLTAAGVHCVVSNQLEHVDRICQAMFHDLLDEPTVPALVETPGVSLEQVGRYFEAAAEFYRQAPWKHVPGDTPIKVECSKFQSGPWYAFVMGQAGMTIGLALYDDLSMVRRLLEGQLSGKEGSRQMSTISVTFDEEFDMAPADLDAAEQFGWPVAGPEAYPSAMRVNPGVAVRAPLAWELELLEGCLRAVPGFVRTKGDEPQRYTVPVISGELPLVLSWVRI